MFLGSLKYIAILFLKKKVKESTMAVVGLEMLSMNQKQFIQKKNIKSSSKWKTNIICIDQKILKHCLGLQISPTNTRKSPMFLHAEGGTFNTQAQGF